MKCFWILKQSLLADGKLRWLLQLTFVEDCSQRKPMCKDVAICYICSSHRCIFNLHRNQSDFVHNIQMWGTGNFQILLHSSLLWKMSQLQHRKTGICIPKCMPGQISLERWSASNPHSNKEMCSAPEQRRRKSPNNIRPMHWNRQHLSILHFYKNDEACNHQPMSSPWFCIWPTWRCNCGSKTRFVLLLIPGT